MFKLQKVVGIKCNLTVAGVASLRNSSIVFHIILLLEINSNLLYHLLLIQLQSLKQREKFYSHNTRYFLIKIRCVFLCVWYTCKYSCKKILYAKIHKYGMPTLYLLKWCIILVLYTANVCRTACKKSTVASTTLHHPIIVLAFYSRYSFLQAQ